MLRPDPREAGAHAATYHGCSSGKYPFLQEHPLKKPCFRFAQTRLGLDASLFTMKSIATLALTAATLAIPLLSGCGQAGIKSSASSFDFGNTALNTSENRVVVTLTSSSSSTTNLSASLSGDPSFSIDSSVSCGSTLAASGSCSMVVTYTPQSAGKETAQLNIQETGGVSGTQTVQLTGTGTTLSAGEGMVSATNNPLVALYTYAPSGPGTVYVNFGTTTSYGLKTWAVPTPTNGDPVAIEVAGMTANTTYHMQATEDLTAGGTVSDQDHTFTTSSFPSSILPSISVTTASGATPQPGIELMSASNSTTTGYLQAYATDLKGNIIWGYNYPDRTNDGNFSTIVQPIKLLSNGDMIVVLSYPSQYNLDTNDNIVNAPAGATNLIREIDLAGNPIKQITMAQLNSELSAAGYNLTLYDFHHDVTVLPNGHWIVLASTISSETNLTGEPSPLNVVGDVIIDLDTNLKPVWVWNEFDHLDLNRHPMQFPDWTHTNAVLYSPTDGNLVVSIRHQNWIIKINYDNGKGNGDILWHLGDGGDFTLQGGSSPIDWFYAQHDPSFIGSTTAGNFGITMMDNGDDRIDSSGDVCGSSTFACYSTVPIFNVNTSTMTATLQFQYKVPTADYNAWGGNAEVLANGNLEFDLCDEPATSSGAYTSTIEEMTPTITPQTIWTLHETGANLYRAKRIPSLYPGVQW